MPISYAKACLRSLWFITTDEFRDVPTLGCPNGLIGVLHNLAERDSTKSRLYGAPADSVQLFVTVRFTVIPNVIQYTKVFGYHLLFRYTTETHTPSDDASHREPYYRVEFTARPHGKLSNRRLDEGSYSGVILGVNCKAPVTHVVSDRAYMWAAVKTDSNWC